jgi:putative ABC transport system permease protein
MLDHVMHDARFALRTFAKNRAFAALAILTLGLGIGANTAIFSVIYGVLLKPLPYADGDRLVLVRQSAPLIGRDDVSVSIKEFYTYRDTAADFDGLVEFHQMNFDLLRRGEPDRVSTGVVSPNFFQVLGIAPILGRTFVPDDDKPGAPAVLVLSYSYWQRRFGGDRSIVGQVFEMNDRPHTVVGVLPNVPHYPQENDVYMPSSACPFRAAAEKRIGQNARAFAALNVFGRLKPDVSRERAAADLDVICRRFAADDRNAYRPGSGFTVTALGVREEMTRNARPMLLILLGTTGLVLLIACANVANLTLARLLRRDRELAVRSALGAGRGRLVAQLLTESTLLSLAGGAFGLLFAAWTVGLLTTFVQRFTPRTGEVAIDLRVLAFTAAVSILTGVVFGTLPATASRVDVAGAMKQGARGTAGVGRQRIQRALIVVQVGVSVVLLVGAGLLLTSFYRLQRVDPGYRADRVTTAELFTTNFTKYPNVDAQLRFYLPVLERLQAQPGVMSAAITNAVPLRTAQPFTSAFQIEGKVVDDPNRRPTADTRIVSAGFFSTLGVPLVRGRVFTESDDRNTPPVVVVNKAMMRYWEDADPIGSRISLDNGQSWATVVGIVGDVKQFGLDKPAVAQVYTPLRQTQQGLGGLLLLRSNSDRAAAAATIRDAVWALDPDMPVVQIRTLDDIRDHYLATPKLTALLLTIFAALAQLVTVTGITGVIATSVSQRTQEFGVRMALGASRQAVLHLVVSEGLRLVVSGIVLGAVVAAGAARVLSAYLFDTKPTDPLTFALVVVAFVGAGIAACAGPAWRATTVDPITALRVE